MTAKIAEPKTEPAARKGGSRRIVYFKDPLGVRPNGGRCPSISCPGHCSCASKTKKM